MPRVPRGKASLVSKRWTESILEQLPGNYAAVCSLRLKWWRAPLFLRGKHQTHRCAPGVSSREVVCEGTPPLADPGRRSAPAGSGLFGVLGSRQPSCSRLLWNRGPPALLGLASNQAWDVYHAGGTSCVCKCWVQCRSGGWKRRTHVFWEQGKRVSLRKMCSKRRVFQGSCPSLRGGPSGWRLTDEKPPEGSGGETEGPPPLREKRNRNREPRGSLWTISCLRLSLTWDCQNHPEIDFFKK